MTPRPPPVKLELSDDHGPSLLQRMTWTYALGREDALYRAYRDAGLVQ